MKKNKDWHIGRIDSLMFSQSVMRHLATVCHEGVEDLDEAMAKALNDIRNEISATTKHISNMEY